jgi:hypothetical protein
MVIAYSHFTLTNTLALYAVSRYRKSNHSQEKELLHQAASTMHFTLVSCFWQLSYISNVNYLF